MDGDVLLGGSGLLEGGCDRGAHGCSVLDEVDGKRGLTWLSACMAGRRGIAGGV